MSGLLCQAYPDAILLSGTGSAEDVVGHHQQYQSNDNIEEWHPLQRTQQRRVLIVDISTAVVGQGDLDGVVDGSHAF